MTWLRKLVALAPAERQLFLAAAAMLPLVRVAVRLLPFRIVWRRARRWARPRAAGGPTPTAERITWAIAAAARRVPGGRHCLTRSLVAYVFLGRAGHTPQLRIGVTRAAGAAALEAHAWIEGASDARGFTPLPPLEHLPA
jgi:hypothetical protein